MNLTSKAVSIALLTAGLSSSVMADFVGLNIGASHWSPDLTGSFNSTGSSDSIQLNELGYSDETSNSVSLSFEHPVPFIPNIRVQLSDLDASSTGNFVTARNFDGNPNFIGDINSTLDLSHNDIALYYEILDNWINIDVGIDLKQFDGKVSIRDTNSNTSSITVDETIPMLYLAARFDLPLTGFYVGANIQHLSIGDSTVEDTTFMVGYESSIGLGIEGGIKTFSLELDDASDLDTNLEYDGLYLNGYFHF